MPEEPDLQVYHGMSFIPPDALFLKSGTLKADETALLILSSGTLKAGETALLILARPPFDCVWRPLLIYDLPLAKPQLLLYTIKARLHVREKWEIHPAPQGAAYTEWVRGVWITNVALSPASAVDGGIPPLHKYPGTKLSSPETHGGLCAPPIAEPDHHVPLPL